MTVVEERTSREACRDELAALLELEPGQLTDRTRLVEDLCLDSLCMMRILVWREAKAVVIDDDRSYRACVGDLLSLVESASPGITIRIGDGSHLGPIGVADVPAASTLAGTTLAGTTPADPPPSTYLSRGLAIPTPTGWKSGSAPSGGSHWDPVHVRGVL